MRRGLAALVTAVALLLTTAAGTASADSDTRMQALPALVAGALAARYNANRSAIERAAKRAPLLASLAAPGRQFLQFDPSGRAVEVLGNLATATQVSIFVPGADTSLSTFDQHGIISPGAAARALYAQEEKLDPDGHLAVIAWLGYTPPSLLSASVALSDAADQGAKALRPLVDEIAAHGAKVSLLCHSYGSVVCGNAASDKSISTIEVVGSPGMDAPSVKALHTKATVWVGRSTDDWIQYVPHLRILGVGFGADPDGADFGGRRFSTGDGSHSDYFEPGSLALENLALIALGRSPNPTAA